MGRRDMEKYIEKYNRYFCKDNYPLLMILLQAVWETQFFANIGKFSGYNLLLSISCHFSRTNL